MTIVKTMLMAAALALPVTTLSVIPGATPAEAASAKKGKKVAKAKAKKVTVAKGKSCGTYMYWKGGKCNDGRLKSGKIV